MPFSKPDSCIYAVFIYTFDASPQIRFLITTIDVFQINTAINLHFPYCLILFIHKRQKI